MILKGMDFTEAIKQAVNVLRGGGVILYPTDTIWGIGCDATNPLAVARVYQIKRRADSKALVLLADSLDMVARYVKEVPGIAVDLVEVNDRPMTLIYPGAIAGVAPEAAGGSGKAPELAERSPLRERLAQGPAFADAAAAGGTAQAERSSSPAEPPLGEGLSVHLPSQKPSAFEGPAKTPGSRHLLAYNVVAEDGSVGIRIPMVEFCRQMCYRLGRPIVSTSANISGEPSPRSFAEIPQEIRDAVDFIMPRRLEEESTGLASQIIKVGLDSTVQIIRG